MHRARRKTQLHSARAILKFLRIANHYTRALNLTALSMKFSTSLTLAISTSHALPKSRSALALTLFLALMTNPLPAAETAAAETPEKQTVVYKRVGMLEIKADVFSYRDTTVRPVVVWLHGGALINGHRESVSGRVRNFALTNGYVLVSFDYRLAPETKLPGIIEDLEDAFRWLRREGPQRFHTDPDRLAVTGGSAGGYLTLVTGHRVEPRPRVLLAFWGYGDLVGDWYSTPSPHPCHNQKKFTAEQAWPQVAGPAIADARERKGDGGIFYNYCRQTGAWPTAVTTWDLHREPEKFFPFMPVKNVRADFPPTVLIHGTADTDVPFGQSQMMAREFARHGVPHQFHEIARGEHGLAGGDREQIEAAHTKAFAFVKEKLERP